MIAGAFIYPFSTIVALRPDIFIRAVNDERSQVDAIVRTMVTLADGDHAIAEILVCNPFTQAIWSVDYMRFNGFDAVLLRYDQGCYIRTPGLCEIPIMTRPFRLAAQPRVPSPEEFLSAVSSSEMGVSILYWL